MRYLFVIWMAVFALHAIDYSNMFLTNERENPYSSLTEEDEKEMLEKKKKTSPITNSKKKSSSSTNGINTVYQMQLGFESQDNFDDKGYGLIFSMVKPMPHWSETNKGYFAQADLLYTIKDLRNTQTGVTQDYLSAMGYVGYAYELNDKTSLTPKAGMAFVIGDNDFEIAYGVGIVRKLLNPKYQLIAGWLAMGDLTIWSIGAQSKF